MRIAPVILASALALLSLIAGIAGAHIRHEKPQMTIPDAPLPVQTPESGPILRRDSLPGPIRARVTSIIDGDTFEAKLRLWFGLEKTVLVRVRGIDAPEMHARCAVEASRAQAAKVALRDYLDGTIITLRNLSVDKYGGRVVANVYLPDPDNLNAPLEDIDDLMLAGHLARAYNGGRRGSWCAAGSITGNAG